MILQNIHITAETSTWALTRDEAKLHLNILDTSYDNLIDDYIESAHRMLYQEASVLVDGTATGYFSEWEDIVIPLGGVSSIAVYYYNTSNVRTLLDPSNYTLTLGKIPRIEVGDTEPDTYDRDFPYEIDITCGVNTNSMVKQALRMLVADLFESRQTNVQGASVNREMSRATDYQLSLVSCRLEI